MAHDEVLRSSIEAHDGFCSATPVMVWLPLSPHRSLRWMPQSVQGTEPK